MKLQQAHRSDPEINLTSLIDVVLLLLVFFMVTTSFVRESELAIRLPEVTDEAPEAVEEGDLEIIITAKGAYFVNKRALVDSRPATLRAAIVRSMPDVNAKRVSILADSQAAHQSVVTAMDVAGKLGFVEISIATLAATETPE